MTENNIPTWPWSCLHRRRCPASLWCFCHFSQDGQGLASALPPEQENPMDTKYPLLMKDGAFEKLLFKSQAWHTSGACPLGPPGHNQKCWGFCVQCTFANAAAVICTRPSSDAYILRSCRYVLCNLRRPPPGKLEYSPWPPGYMHLKRGGQWTHLTEHDWIWGCTCFPNVPKWLPASLIGCRSKS